MNLYPVLDKVPPDLRLMYHAYMPEIQAIRAHWADLRREMKAKALVEHNMLCRDLHPVERKILGHLVPDLDSKDGFVKKRAMLWILKQPWGEDFKPAPIEKQFKGVDLGLTDAAQSGAGPAVGGQ